MTQPRMCLPGASYLVTRTCSEQRALLKPDPAVERIFGYCLARAMVGTQVQLHAVCVMSTHYHLVATDPRGDELHKVIAALDRTVALCLKRYYREAYPEHRLENFWSPGSYNANALVSENATFHSLAYTLTNPVKDGLLPDYRRWPGLHTKPRHWTQRPRVFERPKYFFNQSDTDWETAALHVTPPPMLDYGGAESTVQRAEDFVQAEQSRHCSERAASGKPFLGLNAILAQHPFEAPGKPRRRSALEPHLAAGGDQRAMQHAKLVLKRFRTAYRNAYKALCAGLEAVFPHGTLALRLRFNVICEPPFTLPWCSSTAD